MWPRRGAVTPPILSPWFSYPADRTPVQAAANVSATIYGTANYAQLFAVWVPEVCRITTWWWQNGATVNGNVDMGIYTRAGVRLVSMGSVAQSGASAPQTSTANLPATLPAGELLLAFILSSATATLWQTTEAGMVERVGLVSSIPLPSTLTLGAYTQTAVYPKMGVLVAPRTVL
jgi:hypothetical protein